MINQSIQISVLENHLLCPMQCCLNDVHISKVLKFLADSPNETTHTIQLIDPFNTAHSLIIAPQLSGETSNFEVYSPSVAKYENEDIPKMYLRIFRT